MEEWRAAQPGQLFPDLLLSSCFFPCSAFVFPFYYFLLELFKEPLERHVYLYLFNTDVSGRFTGKCCK